VHSVRFDGKVVAVTGAGRGLGAAYARLLAERGASVVVNDLGTSMSGEGASASAADSVVSDIVRSGGAAIANYGDITEVSGAASIVDDALTRFGRLDALINNAGIVVQDTFLGMTVETIKRQLDVHLFGSINVTQAAWPALVESHGSVLLTVSAGMLGSRHSVAYNIAKGAVLALMRSLACEGSASGVRVNAVMPGAETRMQGTTLDALSEERARRQEADVHSPANAAHLACFLIHDECPANGEVYASGRGHLARILLTSTGGITEANPTLESVAERFADIRAMTDIQEETDLEGYRQGLLSLWS
jgi:NAD(P)-dependent dehydrogenase (short-subunit alcohol dehydrogenase family)